MDRKLSSVAESPTPNEEGGSAGSSVALRTKLYFGAGAGGEAASMWTFNALLLIFYHHLVEFRALP